MRIVFIGGGSQVRITAKLLMKEGHEIVIIERSQEVIDELSSALDCGFIHGDGTKPSVLEEASPENTDVLLCMSDRDTDNILAAQVAETLDFPRVVLSIEDGDLAPVCSRLGLDEVVYSDRHIASELLDLAEAGDGSRRSAFLRGDLRFYGGTIEKGGTDIGELDLPDGVRVVCIERNQECFVPNDEEKLEEGDLVICVARQKHVKSLAKQFADL